MSRVLTSEQSKISPVRLHQHRVAENDAQSILLSMTIKRGSWVEQEMSKAVDDKWSWHRRLNRPLNVTNSAVADGHEIGGCSTLATVLSSLTTMRTISLSDSNRVALTGDEEEEVPQMRVMPMNGKKQVNNVQVRCWTTWN